MKCPNCKDISLTMSERSGVEIDYCPECRGVWLDRGELDKILEKTNAETRQTPPPHSAMTPSAHNHSPYPQHQQQSYDQQQYYKYKRKKSFLEELFD